MPEASINGAPLPHTVAPPARVPGQPGAVSRHARGLIGAVAIAAFLIAWEIFARARVVPEMFLPGPSDVVRAFGGLVTGGGLAHDCLVTGEELLLGYLLATFVGLPMGLLMAWYKPVGHALDPFVNFFLATPRIALFPLFLIWFGIGIGSKVAVVFLGAFFPIVINTMVGVSTLDPALIRMARAFKASDLNLFATVALPGAVPMILSGMRLGLGQALIAVVVGEMISAEAGVGLMMANAGSTFQTSRVFAGILIVAGAGMILTYVLQRIEQRFQSWKPKR